MYFLKIFLCARFINIIVVKFVKTRIYAQLSVKLTRLIKLPANVVNYQQNAVGLVCEVLIIIKIYVHGLICATHT